MPSDRAQQTLLSLAVHHAGFCSSAPPTIANALPGNCSGVARLAYGASCVPQCAAGYVSSADGGASVTITCLQDVLGDTYTQTGTCVPASK